MTRLTVELEDIEYQRLVGFAEETGRPIQSIIGEWINKMLERRETYDPTKDPLYTFEGYDNDVPSDLSVNHDTYLYGGKYPL